MTATKRKNINPRIERKITRISSVREVKQTFLIICEGVNTEPDYFNALQDDTQPYPYHRSAGGCCRVGNYCK